MICTFFCKSTPTFAANRFPKSSSTFPKIATVRRIISFSVHCFKCSAILSIKCVRPRSSNTF